MRTILTLLGLLFGSTTTAPAEQEGGGTVDTGSFMDIQAQAINQVIDKAMRWQSEHPASVADNELMEVVEEAMFFYALHSGQRACSKACSHCASVPYCSNNSVRFMPG